MQRRLQQLITKPQILKSVLIFFLAFLILLVLWLQIKETYVYGITLVASKFAAKAKGVQVDEIIKEKDVIRAFFRFSTREKYFSFVVPIELDVFSSHFPFTLSILASLYPFIRRKMRAYTEALLLLFLFHLLITFFWEIAQITNIFAANGIKKGGFIPLSVHEFFIGLTRYAAISFAPFLLGVYVFVRFRR